MDLLEGGAFDEGSKLPGGRELAEELSTSLLSVQNELSSLSSAGVLQLFSGSGTFVARNWRERLLRYTVLTHYHQFKWFGEYRRRLREISPEFYAVSRFNRAMIEIHGVVRSQHNMPGYQDLAPLLDFLPEIERKKIFDLARPFTMGGRVYGVPLTVSPRLMFYNRRILRDNKIVFPEDAWSWADFLAMLDHLPDSMPGYLRFDYEDALNVWVFMVMRAGGRIFDPADKADPVHLDHPEAMRGAKLWCELRAKLNIPAAGNPVSFREFREKFIENEAAFFVGNRVNIEFFQEHNFDDYGVAALPVIKDGCDYTSQALEVLRIRRECPQDVARRFLKEALSPSFQRMYFQHHYGFPVTGGGGIGSKSFVDERDAAFFHALPCARGDYIDGFPGLLPITERVLGKLFQGQQESFEEHVHEVAGLLRGLIRQGLGDYSGEGYY